MDVSVGFDAKLSPHSWAPVLVEMFNDGPPVEGFVELRSPQPSRRIVYNKSVVLPTNSRKRLWLYPYVGIYESQFEVRLLSSNGRVLAETPARFQTLPADSSLIASATRAELNVVPILSAGPQGEVTPARLRHEALPDDPAGYDGLTALVLTDVIESEWTVGQRRALRNWVAMGGHLIVSVNNADNFIRSKLWDELLPMRVTGSEIVPGLAALDARGAETLRKETPVAVGTIERGRVRIKEGERPLVVESEFGRGTVTLLTFCIEREPFRAWTGKEPFWRGLLPVSVSVLDDNQAQKQMHWGTKTLDDVFRGMFEAKLERQISLWWLLLLIGCYLVVIGPFDYWLVRHKLKKPVLTWMTFPSYVVGFSVMIYGIGYTLKSGDSELMQVSIVDVEPTTGVAQGTTVAGFYSTSNRRYEFAGNTPDSHMRFTMSGMESPSGNAPMAGGDTRVFATDAGFVASVPVPIWSSKTFLTRWTANEGSLGVEWVGEGKERKLKVTNKLPVSLTEVEVVIDNRVHGLGDLKAQESKETALATVESRGELGLWVKQTSSELNPLMNLWSFGFRRLRPEQVPAWNTALRLVTFSEMTRPEQHHARLTSWKGVDLTDEVRKGRVVVLAYADNFPIDGVQPKFKPDKKHHHALLRCVLKP